MVLHNNVHIRSHRFPDGGNPLYPHADHVGRKRPLQVTAAGFAGTVKLQDISLYRVIAFGNGNTGLFRVLLRILADNPLGPPAQLDLGGVHPQVFPAFSA